MAPAVEPDDKLGLFAAAALGTASSSPNEPEPSTVSDSYEVIPNRFGSVRSRGSFGEAPAYVNATEPGVTNPNFNADEPPSSAPVEPIIAAAPVPLKSSIRTPKEDEPDYEEVPEKSVDTSPEIASASKPTANAEVEPRTRKISRVLFAPADEVITIHNDRDNDANLTDGNADAIEDTGVGQRMGEEIDNDGNIENERL